MDGCALDFAARSAWRAIVPTAGIAIAHRAWRARYDPGLQWTLATPGSPLRSWRVVSASDLRAVGTNRRPRTSNVAPVARGMAGLPTCPGSLEEAPGSGGLVRPFFGPDPSFAPIDSDRSDRWHVSHSGRTD